MHESWRVKRIKFAQQYWNWPQGSSYVGIASIDLDGKVIMPAITYQSLKASPARINMYMDFKLQWLCLLG